MEGCSFSHLLGVIGFSEPCDTGNPRQGLFHRGAQEGRRVATPKEAGTGPPKEPQGLRTHPPCEAARRWAGERGPGVGLAAEGGRWGRALQQERYRPRLRGWGALSIPILFASWVLAGQCFAAALGPQGERGM